MRSMSDYYQQGDVLLKPVSKIPDGAKKINTRVIEVGEATGHCHAVKTGDVKLFEKDGTLYLKVAGDEPAIIEHQEHGEIEIDPGLYRRDHVREFDHFEEEIREVRD